MKKKLIDHSEVTSLSDVILQLAFEFAGLRIIRFVPFCCILY